MGFRIAVAVGAGLLLGSSQGCAVVHADEIKGTFHFGRLTVTPTDAIAYQVDGKEPGKPVTVVAFTDFKIDRLGAMEAIDTPSSLMGQIMKAQAGNLVIVALSSPDRCGASAYLGATAQQISLGESFTARTKAAGAASRISGECATSKPGKMFNDAYDFRLSYDLPLTAIPKPSALPAGGGEPGAAYVALVKAIQVADFAVARRHLPQDQISQTPPKASELKDYFHGLALNYPKTASVVGGLVKGDLARLEIQGVHYEGKKLKGVVNIRKAAGTWKVVDQALYFAQ